MCTLVQVFPQLSSSRADEYASDSWYCVTWQPVYTIPQLPDQASLAKGSFLTFHTLAAKPAQPGGFQFPTDKVEGTAAGETGEELSRGRTRSRSCSPNQLSQSSGVNAAPLGPVPRLKFQDGEEDTASGSASSSPSSSPIGSATSGTLRRERSHSSPAIGRRDRSRSDLMSSSDRSRRDSSPRSGGGRKPVHGDSTSQDPHGSAQGKGNLATPRAADGWADLPARELSPSLDAVATPGGKEAPSTARTNAVGESAKQLSPPQVEGVDKALEGSQFPALGGVPPPQPAANESASAEAGSGVAQPSISPAAPKKSAWGGRSFAAIVRAGGTGNEQASKAGSADHAGAGIGTTSAAGLSSSMRAREEATDGGTSTIAVTVTVSPNSQRAAANKGPGGRPVKLTGAWQQKPPGKTAAHVEATGAVPAPPVVPTNTSAPHVALSSSAGSGSNEEAASRVGAGLSVETVDRWTSDGTSRTDGKASEASSQDKGRPAEQGEKDDEDCGTDMSPGLIGLGIGARVDSGVWELGVDDSETGGTASATGKGGNDDDSEGGGRAGMKHVQGLIEAVPSLLQAGRVALPGAWVMLDFRFHSICRCGSSCLWLLWLHDFADYQPRSARDWGSNRR